MSRINNIVAITGSNGFIGSYLCDKLSSTLGLRIRKLQRRTFKDLPVKNSHERIRAEPFSEWSDALSNVDTLIHCAGYAHRQYINHQTHHNLCMSINYYGTINLARQCVKAGVRRMIFLSTVKVLGEFTQPCKPFNCFSTADPQNSYAFSKYCAEQELLNKIQYLGLEIVILRPPLVYGPGVKANFLRLMGLVASGVPLPFRSVSNRRSMIYIDNLASLITVCISHPAANGRTFLLSDGYDLTTPALISKLSSLLHVHSRLFSFPPSLLIYISTLMGAKTQINRLIDSLQVDIGHTVSVLGCLPMIDVDRSLAATVNWYISRHSTSTVARIAGFTD